MQSFADTIYILVLISTGSFIGNIFYFWFQSQWQNFFRKNNSPWIIFKDLFSWIPVSSFVAYFLAALLTKTSEREHKQKEMDILKKELTPLLASLLQFENNESTSNRIDNGKSLEALAAALVEKINENKVADENERDTTKKRFNDNEDLSYQDEEPSEGKKEE